MVLESRHSVFGTVQTLASGRSLGLNAKRLELKKQDQVELHGANASWVCTGKSGALFDGIESRGLQLGRLVFGVHQRLKGEDCWVESTRVTDLETEEQPDAWVVEAEVENGGGAGSSAGFRARVQAVVFKKLGLAFVRPLWIQSVDTRNWQLVEAYWFCRSEIGGSTDEDIVGGPGVPNYYRAAHFITDQELGGCFGSLGQPSGWEVTFWTSPQGGIHPDSRIAVGEQMYSGKRWEAERMPYLWVYASNEQGAWKHFSKLNQEASQLLVRATQGP